MINFEIDTSKVEALVGGMSERVQSLGRGYVEPELIAWQQEDMHRRFPNVEVESLFAVTTLIWPRSRTYDERHKHQVARRVVRRPLASMPRLKGVARTMHRPILRPALFDRLIERMGAMMEKNLAWNAVRTTT